MNVAPASACVVLIGCGGDSNAMPPSSSDTSDCVRTSRPLAVNDTSTPLAFQKRVSSVTNPSYGALTNTRRFTDLPSGARS